MKRLWRLVLKFEKATRLHEMAGSFDPEMCDKVRKEFREIKRQLKKEINNA